MIGDTRPRKIPQERLVLGCWCWLAMLFVALQCAMDR